MGIKFSYQKIPFGKSTSHQLVARPMLPTILIANNKKTAVFRVARFWLRQHHCTRPIGCGSGHSGHNQGSCGTYHGLFRRTVERLLFSATDSDPGRCKRTCSPSWILRNGVGDLAGPLLLPALQESDVHSASRRNGTRASVNLSFQKSRQ